MLPDLKTTGATLRHALIRHGIYLPRHKKGYTSVNYMKNIINGKRKFKKTSQIKFVDVPLYAEMKPENVID